MKNKKLLKTLRVVGIVLALSLLGTYFFNSNDISTDVTEFADKNLNSVDNPFVALPAVNEVDEASISITNQKNFEEMEMEMEMEAMVEMEVQPVADDSVTSLEYESYADIELLTDSEFAPDFAGDSENPPAFENTPYTEPKFAEVNKEVTMEPIPDEINDSEYDNQHQDQDTLLDFTIDMGEVEMTKESLEVIDVPDYIEEPSKNYEEMAEIDIGEGDNE